MLPFIELVKHCVIYVFILLAAPGNCNDGGCKEIGLCLLNAFAAKQTLTILVNRITYCNSLETCIFQCLLL